jgi:hypothetical protein
VADTGPGDMHWIIIRAIIERGLLGIYYEPGARIIEPCAYGLSREHHGLLRAFQTAGASTSGKHVNWKLLRTDKITQIDMLAARFDRPRPEYRRGDKAMVGGIYCQI